MHNWATAFFCGRYYSNPFFLLLFLFSLFFDPPFGVYFFSSQGMLPDVELFF